MQLAPASHAAFPLQELDQLEAAIAATALCLNTLQARRDHLASQLDEITRPTPPATPATQAPVVFGPGFIYRGRMVRGWSAIDVHVKLLRALWEDLPERREEMAQALALQGWSRTYVARSRAALFPGKSAAWAHRYSRPLADDWVLDTNLNRERIRKLAPVAVSAAGLVWDHDVKLYWRSTPLQG